MTFDAPTVAALQATLLGRAWAQQFVFTTRPAGQLDPAYIEHPVARFFRPLSPTYQGRSVISWSATYRSPVFKVSIPALNQQGGGMTDVGYSTGGLQRTFGPETVVCDTVSANVAQGLMLLWIQQAFDLFDQRSKAANLVPQMHP